LLTKDDLEISNDLYRLLVESFISYYFSSSY